VLTENAAPQESWYEKLNRWDEALEAYERKYRNANGTAAYVDAALGRLRWGHLLRTSLEAPENCYFFHPSIHLKFCSNFPDCLISKCPCPGACMRWRSGSG
jgi:hypothetical protein